MRFIHVLTVCAATMLPLAAQAQTQAAPTTPTVPPTPGATAGGQEDMMKMMTLAAHNQLGVIEWCKDQGSIGDDVVALQKRMLGMLPPTQVDGLDEAEATGRKGIVEVGGNKMDIKQAATTKGTTPDAMCKQIGTMLTQQAAMLPK